MQIGFFGELIEVAPIEPSMVRSCDPQGTEKMS